MRKLREVYLAISTNDKLKDMTHLLDERAHDVGDRDRIGKRGQPPAEATLLQESPHQIVKQRG
jgi:hypothetical protein